MKLKHVNKVWSKGRPYYYHRITGEALGGDPKEDPAIAKRVLEINSELEEKAAKGSGVPGSMNDLIATYKAATDYTRLATKTKKDYSRHCDFLREHFGKEAVAALDAETVYELRDLLSATPRKSDYVIQVLSKLCSFALQRPRRFKLTHNPCQKIARLSKPEGYKPWPDAVQLAACRAAYPELLRLITMALYTGQRGQDCVVMAWDHYDGTAISVVQQKTGKRLWIPAHPDIQAMLSGLPQRKGAILRSRKGRPWKVDHMRHEIAGLMAEIEHPDYSLHGLRKNAVINLLEAGCSEDEVSSITGQTTQTIRHYARRVSQKRLAAAAMAKLIRNRK